MGTPSKNQLIGATAACAAALLLVGLWTQARLGDRLLPHSFCITASAPLLWLHLVSDAMIALAYLLIPWSMLYVVRRRPDIPLGWVAWLFGAFIVACGATHAMEVWTLYVPVYWYSGVLKAFTAAVSLGTAWMLYQLTPVALALPSSQQMRAANAALEREVAMRRAAEAQLARAKADLEVALQHATARAQRDAAVLDRFFEMAPVGLAVLDGETRFVRVNPALPEATGRQPRDYVDRLFSEVPDMPAEAVAAVQGIARDRQARLRVVVSRRDERDGQQRHWLKSYFPIELPGGTFLIGNVVEDVTHQRRVEEQLAGALQAAQEASRAKDEFLAKVSHELRSPLQVALSSTEVLKRVPNLPDTVTKLADRLAHAVRMQARMINDLLDLSRILSGKMEIVSEVVDPAQPLTRVIELASANARSHGVTIRSDGVRLGDAWVYADPARLEQVYTNLIENAVRFSPAGAGIVISTDADAAAWRCTVRDYGMGMTAEELQRAFEPFAQGRRQPEAGKGLGLGLAIVRSLVHALGGEVRARSDGAGQGCEFTVSFKTQAAPDFQSSQWPSEPVNLQGLRILYVEDEQDVAMAMSEGLRHLGALVETAGSHHEAMDKLERISVDVLVTDLHLGSGPSGLDVMRGVRSIPRHAQVQMIAVSAFGRREDLAATSAAGATAHLVKPLAARQVAQTIQQLRAGHGAAGSAPASSPKMED